MLFVIASKNLPMSQGYTPAEFKELDPRKFILIKGAKVHNLKNLDLAIPRNKLIVVTGLSGSGKSSLAFDTLFAEGQRRYVESLSSYARQFLGRMEKPQVDYIKGLSPAIAIEQKVSTRNPRSTVGTITEIYDYLKLLYARIGKTISPISGEEVKKHSVTDISNFVKSIEKGKRFMILSPFETEDDRTVEEELKLLLSKGFTRLIKDGNPYFIEDELSNFDSKKDFEKHDVLIDRLVIENIEDETWLYRLEDSIQTALFEGRGICKIEIPKEETTSFSDRFELDGIQFEEPSVNFFTFNNPYGACKRCEGYGSVIGIDKDLIVPDKSKSVYEGAIVPWRSETMKKWKIEFIEHADKFDFPIHRPFNELTKKEIELLWTGNKYFKGINDFFSFLESKSHKIQYRVMLSRYRGRTTCPECHGSRLRKDAGYVKINGHSIMDITLMPVSDAIPFFNKLELSTYEQELSKLILGEIRNRLKYLQDVGLEYLNLNRLSSTLSGGEFQRIKLATTLGSTLVGSMYILDEPSIGLHPRDTTRLINVLKQLKAAGNTVIVVEHEEAIMEAADQIIDIGPEAGIMGGNLIFQGSFNEILKAENSYTADYLSEKRAVEIPIYPRKPTGKITIKGARENNLKNITVDIPLGILTTITGVSGSGKSSLVKKLLYPALGKILETVHVETGKMDAIEGDYNKLTHIEFVDQNPIGKSSRSNPVTYIKAYDAIRQLFADQTLAKQRGYKTAHFSFNVPGGRCDLCEGEGETTVEMQFLADLHLTCEDCKGKRFKQEVLEVQYNGKNISDILNLTVAESIEFFKDKKTITKRLQPLSDVGLDYIKLGQSASSLSGGEAQRVKLAFFLSKQNKHKAEHTMFIFDEPTTGLHFHDINKLMKSINALVDHGNTVVIIEHNLEIIKCADWIIDLGPEGGDKGGKLMFEGTPKEMIKLKDNLTARYLAQKLK